MKKEVFTERHIEDAAYLNCPSVESEADWIYGFIAGGKYVKKEYEEKLRWIPVEADNPPIDESLRESDLHYSITVEVMNDIKIQSAYFNTETGQWRSLITGCIINPTHWRRFYNAT